MDPARTASPHMPAHACWPARQKRPACWRAYAQWPAKPAHEDVEPPGETQNEGSAQVEEEAGRAAALRLATHHMAVVLPSAGPRAGSGRTPRAVRSCLASLGGRD